MKDFKENQMYTNDGIFALCSVVKDLVGPSQKTNRPNTAVQLLDKFLFRSPQLPMHRAAVSTFIAGCCYVELLWPCMLLGAWCCSCIKTLSCTSTCITTCISRLFSVDFSASSSSASRCITVYGQLYTWQESSGLPCSTNVWSNWSSQVYSKSLTSLHLRSCLQGEC